MRERETVRRGESERETKGREGGREGGRRGNNIKGMYFEVYQEYKKLAKLHALRYALRLLGSTAQCYKSILPHIPQAKMKQKNKYY